VIDLVKKVRRAIQRIGILGVFELVGQRIVGELYSVYLTLRYVDERDSVRCFRFTNGIVRIRIRKRRSSNLIIKEQINIERWAFSGKPIVITIGEEATMIVRREFSLGEGVLIKLSPGATLDIHGRNNESGSGITANTVILAKNRIEIGEDSIIAWDVFITDSDWHYIEGASVQSDTLIGAHVWVARNASVLKGAVIGADSVIGSGAVVGKGVYPERSLLVGVPAQRVKEVKEWKR
jgi:acetyltransferase-like isoleucine patch superfamily enzyme